MSLFCFVIVISATLHVGDLFVSYGTKCTSNATCIVDTVCLPGVDNIKLCICGENKFKTNKNKCNLVINLRVYNIKIDKVTPTSVKLNWTSDYTQGLTAVYNVSYNNTYQLGDENGVTVDNISPDTLYKFTVQVIISDKHLANQPTYGPFITFSARTSATVTVSSSSASYTTQSHVNSTDLEIESDSNSLNESVANMSEPGAKATGINPIVIIVVGILVVIALLTAILLFILLRRHKRNQATKRGTEHTNNHTDINSFQRLSQASDRNNKDDHKHARKPQTAQETVKQKTYKDKDLSQSKEGNANIYNDTNCLLLVSVKNEDRTSGASTAANDDVAVGDAVTTDSIYSHLSHYHTQKRTETENIYNV
ncbi:Guadeloupe Resistance Complex single-pass transmembrane protein 4 [Biomphalaria glabrata]|uniref:Grctm4 protein n=1 Tax=Biomphalaria glabrata TaxID=6526 RepID=A0A0C9S0I3_BIOGL|nr:Guadeloupe Resistance Complex single-pass transmembrane protein 4 [Biomphalaria glabrata]